MRRLAFVALIVVVVSSFVLAVSPVGATWNQQSTPDASGETASRFSGVSCAKSTCLAVGMVDDVGGEHLLSEQWNGTTWSILTTPTPSGATGGDLTAVSCSSANACVAVGWVSGASAARAPVAELWNGVSWGIV